MVERFPSTKFDWERELGLLYRHAWPEHSNEFIQLNIGIDDPEMLKQVTDTVIMKGRRVIYKQWDPKIKDYVDRFGFYEPVLNIFVAADKDGIIHTAFRPTDGWAYLMRFEWVLEIK